MSYSNQQALTSLIKKSIFSKLSTKVQLLLSLINTRWLGFLLMKDC